VLNHYANFCRTEERRHKERPSTPPANMEDDNNSSWEASLPDDKTIGPDVMIALSEAKRLLASTLLEHVGSLPPCKTVEEHTSDMFLLLGKGSSLSQALDTIGVPAKAKSAILEEVRPHAQDFV
jgi:hypothetical protein